MFVTGSGTCCLRNTKHSRKKNISKSLSLRGVYAFFGWDLFIFSSEAAFHYVNCGIYSCRFLPILLIKANNCVRLIKKYFLFALYFILHFLLMCYFFCGKKRQILINLAKEIKGMVVEFLSNNSKYSK